MPIVVIGKPARKIVKGQSGYDNAPTLSVERLNFHSWSENEWIGLTDPQLNVRRTIVSRILRDPGVIGVHVGSRDQIGARSLLPRSNFRGGGSIGVFVWLVKGVRFF